MKKSAVVKQHTAQAQNVRQILKPLTDAQVAQVVGGARDPGGPSDGGGVTTNRRR
jgi:hypothetical protein